MLISSQKAEESAISRAAEQLAVTIRTAPKACGVDILDTLVVTGEDKAKIAEEMRAIGRELGDGGAFFLRDADNLDASQGLILAGAKYEVRRLDKMCQLCGLSGCREAAELGAACVFVAMDLGIALGAAVAQAADLRIDNRIMFTIGKAAARLGLLGEYKMIMGIPLSSRGKNVFFDRELP
ncbi:MAG: DUF2148 domain-containing protein [Oscillospiraceae bacterium]|jgi:uncharacterized ferredoxin-like protein|nr:DUF2148 domain-containing protein [Oscillospiraceae bacterium]